MVTYLEGQLSGEGRRFGIVVSRFNTFITERLLEGALDCLARHGTSLDDVTVARVPGSFEIPLVAQRMAEQKRFDGIICLAAVIRGATPHFEYVAAEVSKGIAQVALNFDIPAIYGVVTADTIEQAVERAGTKSGNRGWDAALTALEMADLLTRLPERS